MSTDAPSPFHEGDIILRTSDNVDFHVYRIILTLASSFFKDMFSLRQPNSDTPTTNDPPVIPFAEASDIVDPLLRFCYPVQNPTIGSLAMAGSVLEAAIKYDMDGPAHHAKEIFLSLLKEDPLSAFAISCRLQLEEGAVLAANVWKEQSGARRDDGQKHFDATNAGASYVPYMSNISAGAYYRLVQFVRGEAITAFCHPPLQNLPTSHTSASLDSPSTGSSADPPGQTHSTSIAAATAGAAQSVTSSSIAFNKQYPFDQVDADFVVRSGDDVDFKVHKLVLKLHTDPTAKGILHTLTDDSSLSIDGLPAVQVQEHSNTVRDLLQICYPTFTSDSHTISSWDLTDFCNAYPVMKAAQHHGLSALLASCRSHLRWALNDADLLSLPLLRAYCILTMMGWNEEAEMAASHIAYLGPEEVGYVAEMESLAAQDYYRLLSYCHRYRHAMFDGLSKSITPRSTQTYQWKEVWFRTREGSPQHLPRQLVEMEIHHALHRRHAYSDFSTSKPWSENFNLLDLSNRAAKWPGYAANAVSNVKL